MNDLRVLLYFFIPAGLCAMFMLWVLWKFWLESRK
jgi:hypothetical protein